MIDDAFRAWLARRAAGPARALQRAGVTPNQVTITATVMGVAAAGLVAAKMPLIGIFLWIGSRLLDGYDGLLARLGDRTTLFGGYLDITGDMLAYTAMAIGFAIAMPADAVRWMMVLLGYVLAITTTLALSSLAERADRQLGGNRSIQFTRAWAEGGETTLVYVVIALVPSASRIVLGAWMVLLAVTAVQRTLLARRLLR
ncbi:MAG: CDP-alcohol phosphatidyltransferase family protein [Gemmatimonadota bacterium]|nr:CDP-alcohol phosphatidyltransferase family protein [Gemmatimonadota bacterium]